MVLSQVVAGRFSVVVSFGSSRPLSQRQGTFDDVEERATLKLPVVLPAGSKAQLKIDFEGEITGAMMGYYRSAWENEGKTEYYTLTQFEVRRCVYSQARR